MKICLVSLPIRKETVSHPNIGLLFLSRALRNTSHSVSWVDLVRHAVSPKKATEIILKQKPDVIGISGMIVSYYYLEPLVKELKARSTTPVVVGGNIAATAVDIIEKHTEVNFCLIGEAERTFPKLLEQLKKSPNSRDFKKIPGLYWRNKKKLFVKSPRRDVPPDIDAFGFPDYDSIDMKHYISSYSKNYRNFFEMLTNRPGKTCRAFPILTSRGCPFNCSFCFRLIRNVRYHSVEYTLEHIKFLNRRHGINLISIPDELMVANKKFALKLLNAIAKENLGVSFITGGARTDIIDKELLEAFKLANFIMICYGVESGSQKMLDIMNKKIKVEDNLRAITMTLESGIGVFFNLVMGMPGEDETSIRETENFLAKVHNFGFDLRFFTPYLAVPFPETELYNCAVKKGLIPDKHKYLLRLEGQQQYPVNLSAFKTRDEFLERINTMKRKIKFMNKSKKTIVDFKKLIKKAKLW